MSEKDSEDFKYPKAVQDQIDRNLAALKPPGAATDGTSPTNESGPDQEQPRATEPRQQKPQQEQVRTAPETQPEKPAKAEPTPQEDWEKRFKGYKQSTDQTLYELRTALSQKDEQTNRLAGELQQMREFLQRQPQANQQAHPDMPADLKKKLKELYGDDDLDAMSALARHVASKELTTRDRMIMELRQQVQFLMGDTQARQQQQATQAKQQVFQTVQERLEQAVPGWQQIDADPRYIQWMEQPDPNSLSGKPRKEMMRIAYNAGNVADISRFYRDYMNERGLNQPKAQDTSDPRLRSTLPRNNGAAEPNVAKQQGNLLQPGRYQHMVREKQSGRISAEEFQAFEQQYFKALNGGRAA
ncbi:MAG: hypothetical protein H7842_02560 [Gammaproteobacteria bacterium SHHR-1]